MAWACIAGREAGGAPMGVTGKAAVEATVAVKRGGGGVFTWKAAPLPSIGVKEPGAKPTEASCDCTFEYPEEAALKKPSGIGNPV